MIRTYRQLGFTAGPARKVVCKPRPGGVEVRRPPLGGKNEGSIPVVLGFVLRNV